MLSQADLSDRVIEGCIEAAQEASDARNSDHAALVGCLAKPHQDHALEFKNQGDDFRGLAERLRGWQTHISETGPSLEFQEKHDLLADLRLVLTAIRVAVFEIGLHGTGAAMSDSEIVAELGKYARLDYLLRGSVVPWIKADLGITETTAY